jgi:hypothetical protein
MYSSQPISERDMSKPFLYCPKCNRPFHYRLQTPFLLRTLFFYIPIQSFFCAKCVTSRYQIMTKQEAMKYHI